jgi:imidazole glycerol-phosphate synthase subunit HisF
MAQYVRIIPRLDIKGPNLVKGIHLEGLRVLGKPEDFAQHYYETGADELIYMDVVASLYGRNSLIEIIKKTAKEIFIPLTVGGGLRTIDDIKTVLRAGADKVSLNTAAVNNPQIIRDASKIFGSSTIVVSIEAIRQTDGSYKAFTNNGREHTGLDVYEWAVQVAELGAGEIMLTSVDREGTGMGYDLELVKKVTELVPIPVIACGGAGRMEHIKEAIVNGKADAVSLASILHYDFVQHKTIDEGAYFVEGNLEYIMSGRTFSKIKPASLQQVKSFLLEHRMPCRDTLREKAIYGF